MATILLVDAAAFFAEESLDKLAVENTVVLAGANLEYHGKSKNVHVYNTTPMDEKFAQLFDVYSVDVIWYVSGYVDGGNGSLGEGQMFERVLLECRQARVEKVILLSTIDTQNYVEQYGRSGEIVRREYPNSRILSAVQVEEIGAYFSEKMGLKIITLWLPYVANPVNVDNFLGRTFRSMHESNKVMFPYHREDHVDFLSADDLLDLLYQITNETEDESGAYYAVSGYSHTYGDLEEMLKLANPQVQVVYENFPDTGDWPQYPTKLRKKYGFIPMDDILQDIGSYYRTFLQQKYGVGRRFFGKLLKRIGSGIFKYIELLVVFVAAEFISRYTSNSVYFRFVDVRLFFIVIMGTMHGMKQGVLAAILESLVLVWQFLHTGTSGVMLFYNIENWIPFVVYLMAGTIPGYIKDKNTNELKFSRKEYDLLRDKYIFLTNVYHGAIQSKGEFKRQILGFKDSFGKIFDAVQKLDSEFPQSIFLEGVRVMEEILENHSVAIYTLDSWQRFGRLVACSSRLITKLTKSIRIEEYQEMYDCVQSGEVWHNAELKPNLPMYACGVFQNDRMVLLITLQDAGMEQYSMHYVNIFRILCGLVQTSFLRAMEYESLREDQMLFPGTHVARPERFKQLLDVQHDMKEAGVADFVLLRFVEENMDKVSEVVGGMVRASDTLGIGEDGKIYLLLAQMTKQNFKIVGERLKQRGMVYQMVDEVG